MHEEDEEINVPLRLLPWGVTRRGPICYKFHLNDDEPDVEERIFLVEEYLNVHACLSPTVKRAGLAIRHTEVGLCTLYDISRRTFRDWVKKYTKDGPGCFHTYSGRPHDIDDIARKMVLETIRERRKANKKDPVTASQLNALLVKAKDETRLRRSKRAFPHDESVTVSLNTEKKFKKEEEILTRKPKDETHARDQAERSIRCTYKLACMMEAFASDKPAELKWNGDATTFEYKPHGAGDYALVLGKDDDHREEVISLNYPTGLSAFIKQVQLANAAGETGPLMAIAAVPNLPAGEFYVEKIPGFTNEMGVGSEGYLYSCSTRGGNAKLWADWFPRVVVPSIVTAKEKHQHKDSQGKPARAFFYTDGESIILEQVFNESTLKLFADNGIDQGKGAPALSRDHQALDNTTEFMNYKSGTKSVARNRIDVSNPTLSNRLHAYFANLHGAFPSCAVSHQLKEKLIEGLLTLV
eukprot:gene13560-15604_t